MNDPPQIRRRHLIWLAGMALAALVLCAVALGSSGGSEEAASRRRPPGFLTGQKAKPSTRPTEASSISANRLAGGGAAGTRVLPTPIQAKPHGRKVLLSGNVVSCSEKSPEIQKVTVLEQSRRLILTAYVSYPRPAKGWCPETEATLFKEILLSEPNDSRPIYDAARRTPRLVWPRP